MTNSELAARVREILRNAGIDDFLFDSKCILEDFAHFDYFTLTAHKNDAVPAQTAERTIEAARKRAERYPLQYLLGEWEFYGMKFKVGEGVLIPRPDTEILVDTVLSHFRGKSPSVVDLCSGSGCIAAAIKRNLPSASVTAIELSSEAMPYLVENIRNNGVSVKLMKGDVTDAKLLDNFADPQSVGDYLKVDCIVSNPPYLTDREMSELQLEVGFEPTEALAAGQDGLKFYRIIACLWREILCDGGFIAFECGDGQCAAIKDILLKSGYGKIGIIKDYNGLERVVTGIKERRGSDD